MKRELFIHFIFLISFFIFISIFRRWFDFSYIPFWIGGIIGTILPDVDHLIYVYFLRPHELTSQRVLSSAGRGEIVRSVGLLAETRRERTDLVFHTAFFQVIFVVFAFLVITSSGSSLGRGMVLAFMLHIVIDQIVDLTETETLAHWFKGWPIVLDKQRMTFYWVANLLIVLVFGFLL